MRPLALNSNDKRVITEALEMYSSHKEALIGKVLTENNVHHLLDQNRAEILISIVNVASVEEAT